MELCYAGKSLSGLNHEPLRSEKYRLSDAELPLQIDTIWELPQNTFKNKAIVLSGKKMLPLLQMFLRGVFMQILEHIQKLIIP